MIDSLGFIEVYGMVSGIQASDAMLKSANVRVLNYETIVPGIVAIVVEGDLAACRAAVDAGAAAVTANGGQVLGRNIIGRPDEDTEFLVMGLSGVVKIKLPDSDNQLKESVSIAPEDKQPNEIPKTISHDDLFNIIKKSEHRHGATAAEIAFYFPNPPSDIKIILESLVKQKKLRKRASRYGLA